MELHIGQTLREARIRKGIELSEVERVTKIRAKLLSALEEERWQDLPEPVYVRGFLSTYAQYLGLDAEPLIERYREISGESGRPAHVPAGAVHSGDFRGGGGPRPRTLALAALVTAVLLGLVIAAVVGGSGNGGGNDKTNKGSLAAKPGHRTSSSTTTTTSTSPSTSTTTPSQVSVELRSTADVWVCLVDDAGQHLVNSETLPPGQTRGPFTGAAFDMTFGNGSVELTVNGQPVKVPALSEPVGYRITTTATKRLQPTAQPTCV